MKAAYTEHTGVPSQQHAAQPVRRNLRNCFHQPPDCIVSPQHMSALDTSPDIHAHRYWHPHLESPATPTPHTTPRHPQQPRLPGTRPPTFLSKDLRHKSKGTLGTMQHSETTLTIVYVTLAQMKVLHHGGTHHTPFLQLPESLQYGLFYQYLPHVARDTGTHLPDNKDIFAIIVHFKVQTGLQRDSSREKDA